MAWKKILRTTPDGRYLFRPWGQFGSTYELPDKAAYNRAQQANYGLLIFVVILVVTVPALGSVWYLVGGTVLLLVAFFAWMAVEKKNWKLSAEE